MTKKFLKPRRFQLIIDAFDCRVSLLSDKIFLIELVKKIAKMIDMKIIKGPEFAEGVTKNPGLSIFAIIDFSHISIHTFTNSKEFSLDIFSCKPFDYKKVENCIKNSLKIKDKQVSLIGDIWPDIDAKFLKDYVKFKNKSQKLLKKDGLLLAWGKDYFEFLLDKKNLPPNRAKLGVPPKAERKT